MTPRQQETRTSREPVDVDRIVREVLAQLNGAGAADAAACPSPAQPQAAELAIASRVVTMTDVADRLAGVSSVVVPRGAVLTPSVRDLLRRRKIGVAYQPGGHAVALPLAFGLAETAYDPAGILRALERSGTPVERLARTGLTAVVGELCDQVSKGGRLGLLFSGQVAAALCLANRQPGVRAVHAPHADGCAAALDEVAANLLVADPVGRSLFQLERMIQQFVAAGPRACPAQYAQWLA